MQTKRERISVGGGSITDQHVFEGEKERERETDEVNIIHLYTQEWHSPVLRFARNGKSGAVHFALVLDLRRRDKYWVNNFVREKFTLRLTKLYIRVC